MVNYDPATPRARQTGRAVPHQGAAAHRQAGGEPPLPHPAGLPTSYLLDGEGKPQQTLVGELNSSRIEALRASIKPVGH